MKIALEIVTPKGRALATEVDEVNAPSADGEFGVLPGHVPMLASVRPGIVSWRDGSEWKRCAVVTTHDWLRHAISVFRFMMPGEVECFGPSQVQAAIDWAAA